MYAIGIRKKKKKKKKTTQKTQYFLNEKKMSYQNIFPLAQCKQYLLVLIRIGMETSGLILISGLRTSILSMKFHFYTCSQDHTFGQKYFFGLYLPEITFKANY